jgi:nitroreductase
MTFQELSADRYSVRKFKSLPVETDKLAKILEAGRIAPTAHNSQPQRVKVITEPAGLALVDKCTPCRYGAPVVLLVCYDKSICWKRPFDGALSGEVDASIVTTLLMYTAQELGLGSVWVMHFDPARAVEHFALPSNIVPVAMLPLGYPAEDAKPSDSHLRREALENMLF